MTAVQSRQRAALLCRTALPALILAVIAGILGMHVITGNHAAHTLGAAAPPSSVAAPAAGHSHGAQTHEGHSQAVLRGPDATADSCTSGIAGHEPAGAACTPLAKAGSLAAPPPGSTGQPADARIGSGVAALRSYTYLPAGPSPGDLSISRT